MKTADIEVGKTYLYQPNTYAMAPLVEVLRTVSKAERARIKNPGKTESFYKYASVTNTVEVRVVAERVRGPEEPLLYREVEDERIIWVRPQAIVRPAEMEQENERLAAAERAKQAREQEKARIVSAYETDLGYTGLPLPNYYEGWGSREGRIEFPRWTLKDYDRLVELLS